MKSILLLTTLLAVSTSYAEQYKTWGNQIECKVQVKNFFPQAKDLKDLIRYEEKNAFLQMDPNVSSVSSGQATLTFPQSNAQANISVLYGNYSAQNVSSKQKILMVKATMIVDGAAQGTASATVFEQSTANLIMNQFNLSSLEQQQIEDYQVANSGKRLSQLNIAKILFPNKISLVTEMSVYCDAVSYERTEVTPKF